MNENKQTYQASSYKSARNVKAAVIAGIIGGLVGTGVKTITEAISPPRMPGEMSPLGKGIGVVSVMLTGNNLPDATQHTVESITHWVFGTLSGVVYSVVAEYFPVVTIGYGAAFGVVFWLGFHEILLPLIGWSATPAKMTLHEQGNELVSHILYAIGLELTRRVVRPRFDPK